LLISQLIIDFQNSRESAGRGDFCDPHKNFRDDPIFIGLVRKPEANNIFC
jgi:hypothetical protein